MGFFETIGLIFVSAGLGIAGSWVVVQLQLQQLKIR
jgi:hypothetical protein